MVLAEKRLIESQRILKENLSLLAPQQLRKEMLGKPINIIHLVNYYSLSEKSGGGRPPYWEMIFWWTRKPLIGARFVITSSLLPEEVNVYSLAKALGIGEDVSPHRINPDTSKLGKYSEDLANASILDPFAGFGSIPLEAVRLGLKEVVAVELLPTAYIFLKAILEYPARYGRQLIRDVEKWGRWITEQLRRDEDVRELYDEDVSVYIGTWAVKCPHNGRYTPLVANWWLARVRKGNTYTALAYMKPKISDNGEVEIEIVDLNKLHGSTASAQVKDNTITIHGKTHHVPEPNIQAKSKTAICLQDRTQINYIDPETGRVYQDREQAPPEARKRLEFYPKHAINQWNKTLEHYLEGKATLQQLKNSPAQPRLLAKVKVRGRNLEFQPATSKDQKKLWKALEKLKQIWGDPDIPTEPIPNYDKRNLMTYYWGNDKWFKLFNPRQLLTLVKLVKLVRKAGKKVEEEKLREGWSSEEAFKYAEAVTTYLAIVLARFVDHNNIVTLLHPSNPIGIEIAHALSTRGIAMMWNWGDTNPFIVTRGILRTNSWIKCLEKELDGLSYLVSAVSSSSSRVRVLLDDATVLSKVGNGKFDIVVTDPPYYDDVPYAELSDFYYVWLKRALSSVECVDGGCRLVPRASGGRVGEVSGVFYRRVGGVWREVRTQWEEFARREVSINPSRFGGLDRDSTVRWFEERLGSALRRASSLLRGDGLVVTYYNHTSIDAWASLLMSGWELAGLKISSTIPLATESGNRVTARGKVRLDTSIVVVWRKREGGGVGQLHDVRVEALEEARKFLHDIVASGVTGYDLIFASLGRVLSVFTKYDTIVSPLGKMTAREVAEEAYRVAVAGLAESLGQAVGVTIASQAGRFYMITRILFSEASEIRLSGDAIGLLQTGIGASADELVRLKVLGSKRGDGTYPLLYPGKADRRSVDQLLKTRGLSRDPRMARLRSSVDVLHILYYHSLMGREALERAREILESRGPSLHQEAVGIASVLCSLLPQDDEEKTLACRVAGRRTRGGALHSRLDAWIRRE